MGPGYLNSGNIMTLPHGYDLQPIAQNFVDAQFLETMKFTKSDIAALYGVPAHLVGVSDGVKYTNNYGQMMLDFKVNTMAPIFTQYEQELETKLLYDEEILEGKQIRYNTDLLIELDVDTRMKLHRSMLEMGAKTTDEIRAEEGYEAYPDKELSGKPLIATGLMSFEKAFIVKNT
jgi:HK97 family phage portal protein